MSPSAEALNDQGARLMSQGRVDEALALWQQALRIKEIPETLNNVGFLHAYRGEWDQAITSYHRALALRPNYVEALNNLGIAHFQQKRVHESIRCFRQSLTLQPNHLQALNNLGNALLHQGNAAEARDCYEQVLRLKPNDPDVLNNLGGVYRTLHQYDKAANSLQQSLKYNSNNPRALRNLGDVYYDQARFTDALSCYERVLATRPEDVRIRNLVEGLRGCTANQPRVPEKLVASQYDEVADIYDKEVADRLGYRTPELLSEVLVSPETPRSQAILDLGCGTGRCGIHFRERASTLIGVDLSSKMLTRARVRGLYDELIESDLVTATQAYQDRFDVVLASDVLLYLGDLEPVFLAVHRALKPGGRFAFTVDIVEGADYRLQPALEFAHSRGYLDTLVAKTQFREVLATPIISPRDGTPGVPSLVMVLSRPES